MKSAQPLVYCSLLNWNGGEKLLRCVRSIQSTDYENFRLIVIDNNSQDGSIEQLRKAYPNIEVICASDNLGYAGGHELVLERAMTDQADLIWLLNFDVAVTPNTLSALVKAFMSRGDALYGSSDGKQHDTEEEMIEVRWLVGSSLLIPLSVIYKYGFLDTTFFLYQEDIEYAYRLAKYNIRSYQVRASTVKHEGRGSWSHHQRIKLVVNYYKARNQLVVAKRHWGAKKYFSLLYEQLSLNLWRPLLSSVVLGQDLKQQYPSQYYLLLGVKDALLNRLGRRFDPQDFIETEPLA